MTVCVDEVAASGGYLMAAVADSIVASPFAVLGSIGVAITMPNFSERMHREGIAVEEITSGKYKRTLVPYKTPTNADRDKVQQQADVALNMFKQFLLKYRPKLAATTCTTTSATAVDASRTATSSWWPVVTSWTGIGSKTCNTVVSGIDAIATGETWQGDDAVRMGLVDELSTSDEYILRQQSEGADVYMIRLIRTPGTSIWPDGLFSSDSLTEEAENMNHQSQSVMSTLQQTVVSWVCQILLEAVFGQHRKSENNTTSSAASAVYPYLNYKYEQRGDDMTTRIMSSSAMDDISKVLTKK